MTDTTLLTIFGVAISLLALGVSTATMYFAWLRRGRLAMTRPAVVFFGYDVVPELTPKIFLRTLLYSTAQRGKMIESMFVKLRRGTTEQVFGFWGYGETTKLSPGSGLYVGQSGVSLNHHFVLSVHQPEYEFVAGEYTIQVFARQAGASAPILLSEIRLTLDDRNAATLARHAGVLFELEPDTQTYAGHASERSGKPAEYSQGP
ncbi:MAG: hypothetical protein AAB403_12895 [Planctomycetota bacterium]